MIGGKTITIIAAMARNRAIGLDGGMPWHLPGELKHFKNTTMGKSIVMGRKTWESIGVALPGRQNLVVSRNASFTAEGCEVVTSLEEAIEKANGSEVMIIGGGQLYAEALPFADRMVLTLVDCEPQADTWFPKWSEDGWRQVGSRTRAADEKNSYAFQVIDLIRRKTAY
jgi:dihydrofolate reductase